MKSFLWFFELTLIIYLANSTSIFETPLNPDKQNFPPIQFDISSTSDSIEIYNLTFPDNLILKFLLVSQGLFGLKEDLIIKKIVGARDPMYTQTILPNEYKGGSIKFQGLKSSHTYYIYYLGDFETEGFQLGPYIKIFETKQALPSPMAFIEEYAMMCGSFIMPAILLSIAIICIKKIETKSITSKVKKMDNNHNNQVKAIKPHSRTVFRLREQITLNHETLQKWTENNLEEVNFTPWQGRNEIEKVIKFLEEENKEFEDRLICEICCESFREVIFLGCGHVYCCHKCSMALITCPIDKSVISYKYRYHMCDKYGINHQLLPQIIASKSKLLDISKFADSSSTSLAKRDVTLMEKYMMLKAKNENYKMFYNCILCNERKKSVLFFDCKHLICCSVCADKLKACPLDGLHITNKKHVFTA